MSLVLSTDNAQDFLEDVLLLSASEGGPAG